MHSSKMTFYLAALLLLGSAAAISIGYTTGIALLKHIAAILLGMFLPLIAVSCSHWLLYLILAIPPGLLVYFGEVLDLRLFFITLYTAIIFTAIYERRFRWGNGLLVLITYSALLCLALVSMLAFQNWSLEPARGLWLTLVLYLMLFLTVLNVPLRTPAEALNFANGCQLAILFSAAATSVIAILEFVVGSPQWVGDQYPIITGLMHHRTHLGHFAALGVAVAFPRMLLAPPGCKGRWFLLTVVCTLALLLSFARGGWLSGLAAIAVSIIATRQHYWVLVLAGLLNLLLLVPAFQERIFVPQEADWTTGRLLLWGTLWSVAQENFITGQGFGFMFGPRAMALFPIEEGQFRSPDNPYIYAHNDFLLLLVEIGVVGAALLFAMYFLWFRDMLRVFRMTILDASSHPLMLAALGATFVILVAHLVDNAISISAISSRFFAIMATTYLSIKTPKR